MFFSPISWAWQMAPNTTIPTSLVTIAMEKKPVIANYIFSEFKTPLPFRFIQNLKVNSFKLQTALSFFSAA